MFPTSIDQLMSSMTIEIKSSNARRTPSSFQGFGTNFAGFLMCKLDATIQQKEEVIRRLDEHRFDMDYYASIDPIGNCL